MALPRRRFLCLASAAVAVSGSRTAWAQATSAQAYPARPVRIVVGFPPGGPQDILSRLVGQWLSERLGQAFIVENRPGGSGNIGAESVMRAPADGYTLLSVGPANVINATLYKKPNFNFIRDIAPVASISREFNVLQVHPSFPARTAREFIAYAKAHPGKINMASGGNGTTGHVAGELFKMMTGTDIVHVPYRGAAPALTDLLGGQVQMMFGTLAPSIEYLRTGQLRPLAVTMAKRSEALPDIPALGESVPGYEASSVFGLGAPAKIPFEIVNKLNSEINAALADSKIQRRLVELGGTALPSSPADFGKVIAQETDKWAEVIKAAGIKAE